MGWLPIPRIEATLRLSQQQTTPGRDAEATFDFNRSRFVLMEHYGWK